MKDTGFPWFFHDSQAAGSSFSIPTAFCSIFQLPNLGMPQAWSVNPPLFLIYIHAFGGTILSRGSKHHIHTEDALMYISSSPHPSNLGSYPTLCSMSPCGFLESFSNRIPDLSKFYCHCHPHLEVNGSSILLMEANKTLESHLNLLFGT